MNKQAKLIAGIIVIVAVLIVGVLLLKPNQQPQVASPTPEPTATPAPKPVEQAATVVVEPVSTPEPSTPAPAPEKVAASLLDEFDPTDMNQRPLDDREISNLVDEFGVVELYKRLYFYNRRTMQDYFFSHPEALRENLPALMQVEEDSDLRMLLVEMLDPTYAPRETDSYDESKIDRDLLTLLEAPTVTPMSEDEWNARQVLAGIVSDQSAIDFARRSKEQFPESTTVELVASANILRYGGERAPVSPAETAGAHESLKKIMSADDFYDRFPTEKRLLAFESLIKNADQQTLELLRSVQAREPIDHVAQAMNAVLP